MSFSLWLRGSSSTNCNVSGCSSRVLTGTRKFDRGLTQLMHYNLHWLDVPEHVVYKVIILSLDLSLPHRYRASVSSCGYPLHGSCCFKIRKICLSESHIKASIRLRQIKFSLRSPLQSKKLLRPKFYRGSCLGCLNSIATALDLLPCDDDDLSIR